MRGSLRILAVAATMFSLIGFAAACGDDEPATGTNEPLTIEITVKGDKITPNGKTVDVDAGQEVRLEITADQPGEIHVHSEPEQTHEYGAGTTRVPLGAFDVPGQYAVESHALEVTVVNLKVQ